MSKKGNIVPLSGTAHFTQEMQDRMVKTLVEQSLDLFDIRGFLIGLGIAKQITGSSALDELFEAVKARINEGTMNKEELQGIINGLEGGEG